MMQRSTAARADADPINHALTSNGYWQFAPHEALPFGAGRVPAAPAQVPADGSLHLLKAPQGATLTFKWIGAHGAWGVHPRSVRGRRLAFTPLYLGSHGWAYVSPAQARTRKGKS